MNSDDMTFRSAAVARMAGLPVATLRIWEQRYRAVKPRLAPSGHRLYGSADVERVSLLRQLTGMGHAIGSIASLSTQQLAGLADARVQQAGLTEVGKPEPLRLALVGPPLSLRLQRPALAQKMMSSAQVIAVYESHELVSAAASADQRVHADVLIAQVSEVSLEALAHWRDLAVAMEIKKVLLIYRYAIASVLDSYAKVGVLAVKEPADDEAWLALLQSLHTEILRLPSRSAQSAIPQRRRRQARAEAGQSPLPTPGAGGLGATDQAQAWRPRRYSDAELTAIAGLSPTMACECPGHVAELLMQLAAFEAYSAACIHSSPKDAELHAYLHASSAQCRALFETLLERVTEHEGLMIR